MEFQITRHGQFVHGVRFFNTDSIEALARLTYLALSWEETKQVLCANQFPVRIADDYKPYMLVIQAFSTRGKSLNAMDLCRWGCALEWERITQCIALRKHNKKWLFWSGVGPVPGSGKQKASSRLRSIHTQSDRRKNQTLKEEGEPPIRATRRKLPTAWTFWDDDYYRGSGCFGERNWKSQHKGKKSWNKS